MERINGIFSVLCYEKKLDWEKKENLLEANKKQKGRKTRPFVRGAMEGINGMFFVLC
jgi:hypothetical protein